MARKFPSIDSLVAFLFNGILSFNKQKYSLLHFEYLIFRCQICFLARTDQNSARQHCPCLMGARLMENQPEVRQLPRWGMSVSPELSVHICCLRPELLLEAQFLKHYCCVPVHLLSPSASQAKGNITIQLQECESLGPVTPNLLCSLPFFF